MYITVCKLFLYCCSVAKSCPTLCDPMDCSMPGFPVLQFSHGVCSNSCPLHQWCYLTISSSVILVSSCPQSFSASGSFQWVSSSHQVARILELQLQHQYFQWIFRLIYIYIYIYMYKHSGFPCGSAGKESACNAGYLGSTPGLGWSPAGELGNLLQYFCLENPHGQRSLAAMVHGWDWVTDTHTRILEVGGYPHSLCSVALPNEFSLGWLFQRCGCVPTLTPGSHSWYLGA